MALSTVASLVSFVGMLWARSLGAESRLSRVLRFGIALGLFFLAGAGIAYMQVRSEEKPPAVKPSSTLIVLAPAEPNHEESRIVPPAPAAPPQAVTPRVTMTDSAGASVPELQAIAKRCAQRTHRSIRGVLTRAIDREEAPDLAGMFTSRLRLRVEILDASGQLVDAFSLDNRGGGFSPDSAYAQSMERLLPQFEATLRSRLERKQS